MSWQPSHDPALGDAHACDALELVVVPRARDLGGFSVRRALPQAQRQMVGPFIFFDQMGPVQFEAGQGIDVRPHPYIGLATVTYLFDGRVMHRDSEGNALEITPGEMNLMTAGSGIAHSERTPPEARATGIGMYRHPKLDRAAAGARGNRTIVPAFQCRNPAGRGGSRRVGARHRRLGVRPDLPGQYAVGLDVCRGAPRRRRQRAARSRSGGARDLPRRRRDPDRGRDVRGPATAGLPPGDRITVTATRDTRLMFLGGAALEGPRYIWWNFVSKSRSYRGRQGGLEIGSVQTRARRNRIYSAADA